MPFLVLALAAFAAGPVVFDRLRKRPVLRALLDGFVLVSIPGLVLLHVVPTALDTGSVLLLVALLAGVALPWALERVSSYLRKRVDRWGLILGLAGLAAHSGLDGAALASVGGGAVGFSLPLAVVLHRFPVGVGVWWLVSRTMGRRTAVWAIGILMLATVVGFQLGDVLVRAWAGSNLVELGQAFAGGTLMHVVAHRGIAHGDERPPRSWKFVGALVAAFLIVLVALIPG